MKSKILVIVILLGLVAVLFLKRSNQAQDKSLNDLNAQAEVNKNNDKENKNLSILQTNLAVDKSHVIDFDELIGYWDLNNPLSEEERLFFSGMLAKDFLSLYEVQSSKDLGINFLSSYLKDLCGKVKHAESQLDGTRVNRNQNHALLLDNISHCSGVYSDSLDLTDIRELESEKYNSQLQLMLGDRGLSSETLEISKVSGIPTERQELYNELAKSGELEADLIFYEAMTRIDNSVTLNAFTEIFSSNAMVNEPKRRQEIAAWIVTSCASGYPCDNTQISLNSYFSFCMYAGLDCRGKSLQQVMQEYVPNTSYQALLSRSMEISQYINNGNGSALLNSYLDAVKE